MDKQELLILNVKKLRKKLGKYGNYIETVFKVGYVFKEGENHET